MRAAADDLGMEFYSTAEAYKGLAAAAKDTSLEGEGIRDVFLGVANASTALGLSSEKSTGVLRAVEQMMGKGKVSAEELRQQMGEHLPGAFGLAAESMGMTTQELDKLMSDGKIFTEDFLPRFAKTLEEKFAKAATEAAGNAEQSFNRFKTSWTDLKVEMAESGFLDSSTKALNDLTAAMNKPEVISMARELGELMGYLIEKTSVAAGAFAKLVLAPKQFGEGLELVNQGLIDYGTFVQSSFVDRQKLIDNALGQSVDGLNAMSGAFEKISDETGVTITSYKDLREAVEAGTVSFDEASGKWVGAEKKKQNALDETLNAAKDHATQMSVVQDELVCLLTKTADTMIAKIKERAAQGGTD